MGRMGKAARLAARGMAASRAALLLAVLIVGSGVASAQDNAPDPGEQIFRRACAACHNFTPERRMPGPHLVGIIGRHAGTVERFRYSRAMSQSDIVWDEANLTAYLASPRSFLPGTLMVERLRNPADLPPLIDYLRRRGAEPAQ